jgi:hypothetical protein
MLRARQIDAFFRLYGKAFAPVVSALCFDRVRDVRRVAHTVVAPWLAADVSAGLTAAVAAAARSQESAQRIMCARNAGRA